jgi:pimeloyl-ACP methyl ester carboxylesterase
MPCVTSSACMRVMRRISDPLGSGSEVRYAERYVRANGSDLRYVEAGSGETLVWLHGGAGLHPSVGTDLLAQSFRLVAFELPGFGSSWKLTTAATLEELSEQVAGGIRTLGLSGYVLHGTSFGAATALQIALNHPDEITSLVLESPVGFRPPGWTPPDTQALRRGMFRHPERARRVHIDQAVKRRNRTLVSRLLSTVDRDALEVGLGGLKMPALVIFGDGDTLTPPSLAAMYTGHAPDCVSVVIADAGHVTSSDQPESYAAAVRAFTSSAPNRRGR